MKTPDMLYALQPVINAFDKLSIPYCIGGSVASSLYGIARTTLDIDIVADLQLQHIPLLIKELGKSYYIEESMIRNAINNSSSFNLIHFETSMKIDIFILKNIPYDEESFKRRIKDILDESINREFFFTSPEDIIINKLQWYEMGEKISERQWLDVLGVIKVQGESLDKNYLQLWSKKLEIFDLLTKAFADSGIQL